MDDSDKRYNVSNLPPRIERELVVALRTEGYFAGCVQIWEGFIPDEAIELCRTTVEIEIPPQTDIQQKHLAALEEKKRNVIAENHMRLKEVQDKIDNLLAIEYLPAEAE